MGKYTKENGEKYMYHSWSQKSPKQIALRTEGSEESKESGQFLLPAANGRKAKNCSPLQLASIGPDGHAPRTARLPERRFRNAPFVPASDRRDPAGLSPPKVDQERGVGGFCREKVSEILIVH